MLFGTDRLRKKIGILLGNLCAKKEDKRGIKNPQQKYSHRAGGAIHSLYITAAQSKADKIFPCQKKKGCDSGPNPNHFPFDNNIRQELKDQPKAKYSQ